MKNSNKIMAVVAAAFMVMTGCVVCIGNEHSDAAISGSYGTVHEIDIAPGFRWTYTPSFPSDLSVTTTYNAETAGLDVAKSGNTYTVSVKNGITSGSYDLVITATTSSGGISQTAYIHYRFNVVNGLSVSGSINNIIDGASIDFTPTGSSGMGTVTWAAKTLPAGLTFNNGKVTGKPTTVGNNTVVLTATANGESKDLTVSFIVYNVIVSGNDETIYTYGNTVSSTGIQQKTTGGTGVLSVTWAQKSDDAKKLSDIGFTLNASNGVISGSRNTGDTTTIHLVGTDSKSGQTTQKTVTIVSEKALTLADSSNLNGIAGTASTRELSVQNAVGAYTYGTPTSNNENVTVTLSDSALTVNSSSIGNYTVTIPVTSTLTGQTVNLTIDGQIFSALVFSNPTNYSIAYIVPGE